MWVHHKISYADCCEIVDCALFPVFLTSCLSMFLDLTSLTPFFFSSVFKKMITMVTRSSTQVCADAEDKQQQTSQLRAEWRWRIWAKLWAARCPPICGVVVKC